MVRLEKIAYEQIVNSKALGRNRAISTPAKWNTVSPFDHQRKLWNVIHNSWWGRLVMPAINFFRDIEYRLDREQQLERGLAWEDTIIHHCAELRRNIITEHMFRQNMHPYHWLLKVRRRGRYFKVERGCKGFIVPEHVRSEASSQTRHDAEVLRREWWDFIYHNYVSDVTPTAERTRVPKLVPLELLMNFGILKQEAYNRYFMNERDQGWYSSKELAVVKDRRKFPFDLTTTEGKRRFEDYVNKVNEKTPGIVAPEGKQFDFQKYYAEIGV